MKVFTRSSDKFLFLLIFLILITIFNIFYIYQEIYRLQLENNMLDYLGYLRGAVQRVAKIGLSGLNTDKYIKEIDNMCEDYRKIEAKFDRETDLARNDAALHLMQKHWQKLKAGLANYRNNPTPVNRNKVISSSEDCWQYAEEIKTSSEIDSNRTERILRNLIILISINIFSILLVVWLIKVYVQDRLEYFAHHDPLTKFLNRHAFGEVLTREMKRSSRYNIPLSLIMFDIDHFKRVNDKFGHNTGDYVLSYMAKNIMKHTRASDYLCRVGGEEFIVICTNTNLDDAAILAENLRDMIEHKKFREAIHITLSFGVTDSRKNDDAEAFFKRVDEALYTAKNKGRNRVILKK